MLTILKAIGVLAFLFLAGMLAAVVTATVNAWFRPRRQPPANPVPHKRLEMQPPPSLALRVSDKQLQAWGSLYLARRQDHARANLWLYRKASALEISQEIPSHLPTDPASLSVALGARRN